MKNQPTIKKNRHFSQHELTRKKIKKRRTTPYRGLALYGIRHLQACVLSLGQMRRTPFTTIMILVVIGIALALPTGLFVLLGNVKELGASWGHAKQISLYLKANIDQNEIDQLLKQIKQDPGVGSVTYISPEQGLKQFGAQLNFSNALLALNSNPLPPLIVAEPAVNLQTPGAMQKLFLSLQQLPQVDVAKLDMQWVKRLFAVIHLINRLVIALAILFGLGVLLVIGNITYLSMQRYRQEVRVLKLVGATNRFIRRPFLYTGMLYGVFGGLCAWLVVGILLWSLSSAAARLAMLYGNNFYLHNLSFRYGIILLSVSAALGLLGSRMAVDRQLKVL